MNFRKAIMIYGIGAIAITLVSGARFYSWQSILYLVIWFMIGFSFIALFYGYREWKASRKSSFVVISGLGIALFVFLAIILPPWLFPPID
jgi:hypothetical protein